MMMEEMIKQENEINWLCPIANAVCSQFPAMDGGRKEKEK